MKKAIYNASLCKECRLCTKACPKDAIIPLDELNSKGYKIIKVDTNKCIGCGMCYAVCPDYCFEIKEEA